MINRSARHPLEITLAGLYVLAVFFAAAAHPAVVQNPLLWVWQLLCCIHLVSPPLFTTTTMRLIGVCMVVVMTGFSVVLCNPTFLSDAENDLENLR